jgi:hypothetical protein
MAGVRRCRLPSPRVLRREKEAFDEKENTTSIDGGFVRADALSAYCYGSR